MRRTLLALALAALLAAAPAAAQEPGVIATLPNVSPLKALRDTLVWSTRGPGEQDPYRLTVRRSGIVQTVAIGSRDEPDDFDIGTDASGTPLLVYTRCGSSCDLYTSTLDGAEKKITAASSPRADESAPTLWRGRLAWARDDVVYTRRLSDSPRVRSSRVMSVPRRTCPDGPRTCARTGDRSVAELELYGRSLAAIMEFTEPQGTGNGRMRVRLADLGRRRFRTIRDAARGEGGQTFIGASFAAGRLGFDLTCFGDPGGCGYGPHRYRLSSGLLERTAQASALNGFALAGADRAYTLRGGPNSDEAGEDEVCPCTIQLRLLSGWSAAAPRA